MYELLVARQAFLSANSTGGTDFGADQRSSLGQFIKSWGVASLREVGFGAER